MLGAENGDKLLNYLIILGKLFLFRAKTKNSIDFRFFKTILKSKFTTEKEIAKTSGNWEPFTNKWEKYIIHQ